MQTKIPHSLRRIAAGLCGFVAFTFTSPLLPAQTTGPQQLAFAGLLGSTNSQRNAQFNAVQADASGNLYLLLDQKDGVRLLKTDASATNILAQTQLGAAGDIGLVMALDPAGNLYIAGTTTSGSITATAGAAFPAPTDTSTNAFIAKFDANLNPLFITYAGSGHLSVTGLAATTDSVFLTGSIFASTLPVTPSAIIQSPAAGSLQNGFVERFNSTGTALLYATYLSGQNGNTSPAAIAADASDNAYVTGYTTSAGFPTLNALVPEIIPNTPNTTSGFLTKLTPAADGLLFSTFLPGAGITSLALAPDIQNPAAQDLLLSGSIALGQFPVATVSTPLVSTAYQVLLRLPLDGSAVLNSTLLAPGSQSILAAAPDQSIWVAATLTTPSWLLPLTPLSTIGNSYALRVTQKPRKPLRLQFLHFQLLTDSSLRRPSRHQPNLRQFSHHSHLHRNRPRQRTHLRRQRLSHRKLQPSRYRNLRPPALQHSHLRSAFQPSFRRARSRGLYRKPLLRLRRLPCQTQPRLRHQFFRPQSLVLHRQRSQHHAPQPRQHSRHQPATLRHQLHRCPQLPRHSRARRRMQHRPHCDLHQPRHTYRAGR